MVSKYRRVNSLERTRGELYPVWSSDITCLSDFGLGIAVYLIQLLCYSGLFFIAGLIVIASMDTYSSFNSFPSGVNQLLQISAVCDAPTVVVASAGCGLDNTTCLATFREHCPFPKTPVMCDIILSLVFVAGVFAIMFIEDRWSVRLDEAIQTAQDYSLVVMNPPEGAFDIDEWKQFFQNYGDVVYVLSLRFWRQYQDCCVGTLQSIVLTLLFDDFST